MNNKDIIYKFNSSKKESERLLLLPAVLSVIIFTKKFYENNPDLKNFTTDILNIEYREYLFKSRTALYARIIKDFYVNDTDLSVIIKKIAALTVTDKPKTTKKDSRQKSNSQQKIINEWRQVINPKDDN